MKPAIFSFKPVARSLHGTLIGTLISAMIAGTAGNALAGELPKRKPGLWEISMNVEGAPSLGPMQQCIDRNTDDLMQQQAKQGKSKCSVMDVTPSGSKVTIHAVCKLEGSTVTTDGVFEGSFETSYTGRMKSRFIPPMFGVSESNTTQAARWVGPCKPGQKPGDVVMPDMGGMDLSKMLKDPKLQELMKQFQNGL